MEKAVAERIKLRGEAAIRELVSILEVEKTETSFSPEELEAVRRGIGLAIGIIDTELLSVLYRQFPELDPIERS